MKSSIIVTALAVAAVACEGRHMLTGPDARRAYVRMQSDAVVLPTSTLVFVDGKRMPAGTLSQIDPKQIVRIEVVKGQAAVRAYGEAGRAGVINIFTRAGQDDTTARQ